MGFRQYDPNSGRWLTRDPIGYAGGLNLYQYCGNDPVNFTDVLGTDIGSTHIYVHRLSEEEKRLLYNALTDPYTQRILFLNVQSGTAPGVSPYGFSNTSADGAMDYAVGSVENLAGVLSMAGPSKGKGSGKQCKIILPSKRHTNKTPGHWFAILRQVVKMRRSGEYDRIYVNKGINLASGLDLDPNYRPDIIGVLPNGVLNLFEVPSKTDTDDLLNARMEDAVSLLGARGGTTQIVPRRK